MKHWLMVIMLVVSIPAIAQDVNILLKEAQNLQLTLKKDVEAVNKYKEVLAIEPGNLQALVRASELSSAIGARMPDKKAKQTWYNQSLAFANRALAVNPQSADANYARALVAGKLTETESENKKVVAHVKDIKEYADKALAIDPKHAKATYILGKWHYEMVNLSWAKRAAVKLLFGGLPEATIEDAIRFMEKSRTLDKYFVLNHLDLAKAYKYDNKPAKAIEILNIVVKLPNRTADDAALKEEGRKLLQQMM